MIVSLGLLSVLLARGAPRASRLLVALPAASAAGGALIGLLTAAVAYSLPRR